MKASQSPLRNLKQIPTGIQPLDKLLGGGVSMRRITQFSGDYGSGKSTIAAGIVAEAQKMKLDTLWLDTEHRFAFDYFEQLGVDLDMLELSDAQLAEDIFDTCEAWSKKHTGLIVLDSIGGLLTRKEAERKNDEVGFPEAPKMIPGFIRRMVANLAVKDVALLLLNHEKTDFATGALKTLGGKAIPFHADNWIRLRKITNKKIMSGEEQVGTVIEAKVQKGKNIHDKAELHLLKHTGFDRAKDLLDLALTKGVITRTGNTFYLGEEKLGMISKVREMFKDADFAAKIAHELERPTTD